MSQLHGCWLKRLEQHLERDASESLDKMMPHRAGVSAPLYVLTFASLDLLDHYRVIAHCAHRNL